MFKVCRGEVVVGHVCYKYDHTYQINVASLSKVCSYIENYSTQYFLIGVYQTAASSKVVASYAAIPKKRRLFMPWKRVAVVDMRS